MSPVDCLRIPVSIDDADVILTCYGGPDWRSLALLGAGALFAGFVVLLVIVLVFVALSGRVAR